MNTKAMYKSELAQLAGVSNATFRRWCFNDRQQLLALGCSCRSQLLTPAAVRFLCNKYCIVIE